MHYHHTFNFKVKCIFAKNVSPSYPVSRIMKSEKMSTSVFPDVKYKFSSVQSLSRVWLFAAPMDCSTPGLPALHHLPQFAQTHVHRVGDAIQPSHPVSSLSPPAFNLSQHQGLFKWVSLCICGQGIGVSVSMSVLPMNIQGWFSLRWTGWISLLSKGLSRVFFNTTVQKHQFFHTWWSKRGIHYHLFNILAKNVSLNCIVKKNR